MAAITVEDLKAHLNLEGTDADDALLADKIAAAEACVASYVDPALVPDMNAAPAPIKEAVRQLAGHFYENREATLVGVTAQATPFGPMDLVGPYRRWAF